MQRLFTMFPAGIPGVALFVLRSCIAAALVGSTPFSGWRHTAFIVLAGMLVIGFLTPIVCALASAAVLLGLGYDPHPGYAQDAIVVLSTLSMACIGPGAYSVDGRSFGRRVLISTSSPPSTNGEQ